MKKISTFLLYLTVVSTGAAVLILEILGTRLIGPFYGSTVFVWSSLIVVTLGALALGYIIGGHLTDRWGSRLWFFITPVLGGFFFIIAVRIAEPILLYSERFGLQYGPLVAALVLFFLPLLFLGMVSPSAIRLLTRQVERVGRRSGMVFSLATLGSIVGAILSGFVLIPRFPVSGILTVTGLILIGLGLIGFLININYKEKKSLAAILLIVALSAGAWFFPTLKDESYTATTVLFQQASNYGDVKVTGSELRPCLYVNGSNQTCRDLTNPTPVSLFAKQALELMEALPTGAEVLLLGLGGGEIAASTPERLNLDIVELDPVIARVARVFFAYEPGPNHDIIIDDARHFLRNSEKQYDLILENIALGNALPDYVFSRESLSSMMARLKPQGLMAAHIGLGPDSSGDAFVSAILQTSESVAGMVELLSSNPDRLSNFVLYLYDEPSVLSAIQSFYFPADYSRDAESRVVTDDYNPLGVYYLPHARAERLNSRNIGPGLLYAD